MNKLISQLNHQDRTCRINALKELHSIFLRGEIHKQPVDYEYVNNHIHTTYSFSPYSPTKALWSAFMSGLSMAGIMDHDSVSGIPEFIEAGKILNMPVTIGMECRVDMSGTKLEGRTINNPDQKSIAYMAVHGIPHSQVDRIRDYIKPYQLERNKRNRAMTAGLNDLIKEYGIVLDFDEDIVSISMSHDGGTITERHILYALSLNLIKKYGKGEKLVAFLSDKFKIGLNKKVEEYLLDSRNIYYEYDLLGVLKSDLLSKFYIPASKECPHVLEVIELCKKTGAIPAYAYLGDVGVSATGDKKTQKFEDDYLDLLFEELIRLGFRAVTYMPSRNTKEQLQRVKALCEQHSLLQISGEDINSPRQEFICRKLKDEELYCLKDTAWSLVGHEKLTAEGLDKAMFSKTSDEAFLDLHERIQYYKISVKKP